MDFLTSYLPDLRVIISGESNGSVVADDAMGILKDNPQVYSIQTGPPFWHKSTESERALVGGTVSPSIYDVVAVLGQEETVARLQKALTALA